MKIDMNVNKDSLEDFKITMLHNIYRNIFFIMLLSGLLVTFFSTWSSSYKLILYGGFTFVFSTFLLLLYFLRKSSFSIHHKYQVYLALSIVTYLSIVIAAPEKFLTTVGPMLAVIFFMVLFSYNVKHILILATTVIISIIVMSIIDPEPVVELGRGYYIIYTISIILAATLSIRAIKRVQWYEKQLFDEINKVFEKNIELTALNEEYYATQEELHQNYDEILKLNQADNLINQKFDKLLSVTEDGIIDYNITEDSYFYSSNAINHLGISTFDTFESICSRVSERDQGIFRSAWMAIVEGKNQSVNINVEYDKTQYYNFTFIYYTAPDKKAYLIAAIKDVTLLRAHEENIFNLAYKDSLTGLYNRVGFLEAVDYHIGTGHHNFLLAILDVDNFKYYNSIFGYDIGDKILKYIALYLESFDLRFITRVGDDRFAFLFDENSDVHNDFDDLVGNHDVVVDKQINITLKYSIGLCGYLDGLGAVDLLKRAEIAMHEVKSTGKDHFLFYDDAFTETVERRLRLGNALEHAIDNKEIYLNFQPIYKTDTHEILSFESLVRWNSEKFGFIPPNVFIEIAEQSGYIRELGEFITYESCLFAKKINRDSQSYVVSINVSGKQLLDQEFACRFINTLEEIGVKANQIGIEITETAVIENIELAVIQLTALHDYGITIYLDDFGTGYSSLNYLNQLPVDVIKIDKSFIDTITENEQDHQLVHSIIQLAKSLQLKTVAEGVETKEQLTKLTLSQCDSIQGYYFDKPLKEDEELERLSKKADIL